MRQVIEYYKKENCIRIINRKGLKVILSRDLLVYLNKIKIYLNQIKEKLEGVQQEQINKQEDNTQQQINHPTQKSPPLGALSTYNPIIPTTLPPQSTVPKTNTRQQLGSSIIQNTRQIQQQFRENTGNP